MYHESARSSAGPQHDTAKENESPSVQVHSNSQNFLNFNRNPLSEQPGNIAQVASTEITQPKNLSKCTCLSNVDTENATQEVASSSLQYLAKLNEPKETIDGSMSSKLNDMIMFPQDNDLALVSELCPDNSVKRPSQTDTNRQNKKRELALSKSLDLHRICLEKGCKLLETKPKKSSLRRNRSAECLMVGVLESRTMTILSFDIKVKFSLMYLIMVSHSKTVVSLSC